MEAEKQIFKVEDGKVQKTIDGFDNFVSRLGLNNDNVLSAGFYSFNLMTRNRIQLEAAYRGSWIVGRMIDCKADDMTKAGVDIQTSKEEQNIKKMQKAFVRKKIWQSLRDGIAWGDLYGGAIGVLQIRGQDPSTPLDIETVGKDQFLGLAIYDRWMVNPDLVEVIEEGPDIGLPAYYQITTDITTGTAVAPEAPSLATGGLNVHHSRVIRFDGIKLPYFQAITEMMWGESVLERLWDRLISFDSATLSTANLIERANNRTVGIENLREIIAAGGQAQQGLEAMFEMMRTFQTNEGLTLLDKNDTFASVSYTFAGLADVLIQFGQQLSGASEIPLVRLFGQSPAGLSATGESDLRTYYDGIHAKQKSGLTEGVDLVLKVMWRSVFGNPEPEDLEWEFMPLWQMSAKEKAEISKLNTESVTMAHGDGLISAATGMKELRGQSGETGLYSNITDEEIAQADEEPPDPDMGLNEEDPLKEDPEKKMNFGDRVSAWLGGKKHVRKKTTGDDRT